MPWCTESVFCIYIQINCNIAIRVTCSYECSIKWKTWLSLGFGDRSSDASRSLFGFSTPDLMHTSIGQQAKWWRAEQYGGGWAEWHHAGIIDYCPVTMAEEEKQIRLCVIVCVYICVCIWYFWYIWSMHIMDCSRSSSYAVSQITSISILQCSTLQCGMLIVW